MANGQPDLRHDGGHENGRENGRENAGLDRDARGRERIDRGADRAAATFERVAEKMAQEATRRERIAAKVAAKAQALERVAEHLGALDLWTRAEPTARRPRFTRDAIAATAVRIADAECFGNVSMRRIAAELDVGTMTLYHYVRTKDELLSLVVDAVMGEVVIPADEPMATEWRVALTTIAERTRAALERHPWILDIADDPPVGPNSVRHFDQTLQAVSALPIGLGDKFDIVSAVDEYVFGYSLFQRNNSSSRPSSDTELLDYVERLVATGQYPQLAALAAEHGLADAWRQIETQVNDPGRFARNLVRLLDGIEADLASR